MSTTLGSVRILPWGWTMACEQKTRPDRAETRAAFLRAVLTLDRGESRWRSPPVEAVPAPDTHPPADDAEPGKAAPEP